jgi:hypothetical protein
MAGVLHDEAQREAAERVYVDNLRYAAETLQRAGVTAVIEPINKSFGVREAEHRMKQSLKEHSLADLAQRVERKAPKTFVADMKAWFESRRS